MKNIGVVGSINTDIVFVCKSRPNIGETILGDKHFITHGGKGANIAVASAKLGGKVKLFGCVGDDLFSKDAIKNLKEKNVNTNYISKISETPGGVASITISNSSNSIIVVPGANSKLDKNYLNKNINDLLNCDILATQLEIPVQTVLELSVLCKKHNKIFVFNPSPAIKYPKKIFDNSTFVLVNETELKQIKGYDQQNPLEVLKQYPQKVILTMGNKGVYFCENDLISHIPALKVKAVDTTGAGDTFMGAFIVGLSNGKNFKDSIIFANLCAGIKTTKIGTQTGMPTLKEVLEYSSKY